VIVGGGVVGCEFATIFANYGKTKVYVIDRQERILPFEDEDISRLCSTNLERKGVTVHHQCQLVDMQIIDGEVEYTIQHHTGGRESIRVEKALVSIGRVPNTDDLGLENTTIELEPNGHIKNDRTQTNVPHIYAVGDVTCDKALVNVGELEARHAVERICEGEAKELRYENVSSIVFLDPELAAIGLNEIQAQEAKISYKVAVYGYALVNRAIAMRATSGFVKLLVTNDDQMRILGMRALGVHASSTIEAVSLMMQDNRPARELGEVVHPHPAITEGVQDCVRMLEGTSIYKPHVFSSDLRLSCVTYEGEEDKSSKDEQQEEKPKVVH
jgi:dihydrolipoamide dehydrogenase